MRLFITLIFLLSLSSNAFADDLIYLKNGDKLSGTVSTYTSNGLNLTSKYGVLNIPISDIGGIHSNRVEVQNDVEELIALSNKVSPLAEAAELANKLDPAAAENNSSKVEEVGLFGAKWSGNANVGTEFKTGNSDTTSISADAKLKGKWSKHRAIAKGAYNYKEDGDSATVDNRSIGIEHDYFFRKKWFTAAKAKFEQDDIDKLDLRTNLSLGVGYQPYERDDLNLKFVLGPGYIDEQFEDGSGDNSLTLHWAMDYDQRFYDDLFRLFHNDELTSPTENMDDFLFQSKSGISVPIRSGIIASAQIEFDWDNQPAEGTVEDDTTYSLKLGYEW